LLDINASLSAFWMLETFDGSEQSGKILPLWLLESYWSVKNANLKILRAVVAEVAKSGMSNMKPDRYFSD
jgi:hypothetical protein